MKEAIRIGCNATIDNLPIVLTKTFSFCLSLVLLTLLEAIALFELMMVVQNMIGFDSISIFDSSMLADGIVFSEEFYNYVYDLYRNIFGPLILLNSFFLGIYYSRVGFPTSKQGKGMVESSEDILDVPMGSRVDSLRGVLSQIKRAEWKIYVKSLVLIIFIHFISNFLGNFFYSIYEGIGYLFYFALDRVIYIVLFSMYWRWTKLESDNLIHRIEIGGVGILFFLMIVPAIDNYLIWQLKEAMASGINFLAGFSFSGQGLVELFVTISILIVWLPLNAIFFSQTFLALRHETAS